MNIHISNVEYNSKTPFPYASQDNFLDETIAKNIQHEILNISDEAWDRYENPFEKKFTLRDKYAFPPYLKSLFQLLESEEFVTKISSVCGKRVYLDPTRNFWGVHKYTAGDKLDIHLDAAIHPMTQQKKYITFGLYLSSNWKDEYGCQLEIWRGDSSKIYEKVDSIAPVFNRMIIFTNTDVSWHGNPESVQCPLDSQRIFITISYLADHRAKALFARRPLDLHDEEKDKLRVLRADAITCTAVYKSK